MTQVGQSGRCISWLSPVSPGCRDGHSPAPVQSDKTGVFAWDSWKEMFFSEHWALWIYTLNLVDLQYSTFVNVTLHHRGFSLTSKKSLA